MRKIIAIMITVIMSAVMISGLAVHADPEGELRLEAVRTGDATLSVKLITNCELPLLGGLTLSFPASSFDAEAFQYTGGTGLFNGLSCNFPVSTAYNVMVYDRTGDGVTVPAETELLSIDFEILPGYVAGSEYSFSLYIKEAYTIEDDSYNCEHTTITAAYSETAAEAPTVSFESVAIRDRQQADSAAALRVMFKVTFNDSFVNYGGTLYGADEDSGYQITGLSVSLSRTDVDPVIQQSVACSKIFDMQNTDAAPYFLYNVTLTGITPGHYNWQFEAVPTVTFVLGGETFTATCDGIIFSANGVLSE